METQPAGRPKRAWASWAATLLLALVLSVGVNLLLRPEAARRDGVQDANESGFASQGRVDAIGAQLRALRHEVRGAGAGNAEQNEVLATTNTDAGVPAAAASLTALQLAAEQEELAEDITQLEVKLLSGPMDRAWAGEIGARLEPALASRGLPTVAAVSCAPTVCRLDFPEIPVDGYQPLHEFLQSPDGIAEEFLIHRGPDFPPPPYVRPVVYISRAGHPLLSAPTSG